MDCPLTTSLLAGRGFFFSSASPTLHLSIRHGEEFYYYTMKTILGFDTTDIKKYCMPQPLIYYVKLTQQG